MGKPGMACAEIKFTVFKQKIKINFLQTRERAWYLVLFWPQSGWVLWKSCTWWLFFFLSVCGSTWGDGCCADYRRAIIREEGRTARFTQQPRAAAPLNYVRRRSSAPSEDRMTMGGACKISWRHCTFIWRQILQLCRGCNCYLAEDVIFFQMVVLNLFTSLF